MTCPGCGAALPPFRYPASRYQALGGGWTCSSCGREIDRFGEPIDDAGLTFDHDRVRFEIRRGGQIMPVTLLLIFTLGPIGFLLALILGLAENFGWFQPKVATLTGTDLSWGHARIPLKEIVETEVRGRRLVLHTRGGVRSLLLAAHPLRVQALITEARATARAVGTAQEVPASLKALRGADDPRKR